MIIAIKIATTLKIKIRSLLIIAKNFSIVSFMDFLLPKYPDFSKNSTNKNCPAMGVDSG